MKRTHDDDPFEPNKERRISLAKRNEEIEFFRTLWPCEQLRFLLAREGLLRLDIVDDVIRSILLDFLYVLTNSKSRCREGTGFMKNLRAYSRKETPALFDIMIKEHNKMQNQSILNSRKKLIDKGVAAPYIHFISANANPLDGLGAIFAYEDRYIWDDMKILYIPFSLLYVCVDIRDKQAIREYLPECTLSDMDIQELEDEANTKYKNVTHSSPSLWSRTKSILFDDMEIIKYY